MDRIRGYASVLLRQAIAGHPMCTVIAQGVIHTIDTERPVFRVLAETRAGVDAVTEGNGRPAS